LIRTKSLKYDEYLRCPCSRTQISWNIDTNEISWQYALSKYDVTQTTRVCDLRLWTHSERCINVFEQTSFATARVSKYACINNSSYVIFTWFYVCYSRLKGRRIHSWGTCRVLGYISFFITRHGCFNNSCMLIVVTHCFFIREYFTYRLKYSSRLWILFVTL